MLKFFLFCTLFYNLTCLTLERTISDGPTRFQNSKTPTSEYSSKSVINEKNEKVIVEVCYGDLGCFSLNGTLGHIGNLPESPSVIDTKFHTFTPNSEGETFISYNDSSTFGN